MGKKLKEYFIGTETRKFYRRERDIYGELQEKNELRVEINLSKIKEFVFVGAGKYLPNLMDATSLCLAIYENNLNYLSLIGFGETSRLFSALIQKYDKKKVTDRIKDILKKYEDDSDNLEDIIDTSEDWKKLE